LIWIGDEIVSINGISLKGQTKVEAAKLIQASEVYFCLFIKFINNKCFLVRGKNSL
jgi:hypothetical protein